MISSEHFKPIADLDLEPIKVKLMHVESGEGWSLARADAVEFEYRRFLYLMKQFPNEQTAPLMDVDIFWHYHILDTMKYAADCDNVFGYFLHHFPYIGLRGEDDEAAHLRVGERMKELYEETFGEAYLRPAQVPDTAYSGRVAAATATAYSGRVSAEVAYSGRVAAATAYSGRVAYSGINPQSAAAAQTAYSGRVAYSGVNPQSAAAAQTAYSGRVAYSGINPQSAAAAQTAYSGRIGTDTAYSGRIDAAPQDNSFYTDRPRLGGA